MAEIRRGSPEFNAERNIRLRKLELLRAEFPTRLSFVNNVMMDLFQCEATPMQTDLINFIDEQDDHFMAQMPRGQGKTVITSINAVYELIQDPTCRIAIFSGNDDVASEISKYIYQIFHSMPLLEFMLPDRRLKDSSGTENFSVCGYLKGVDKSPSVRCRPIFGGFQGIRADKIIADDVEMLKNSGTADQRDKLRVYIQELESLLDGSKPNQMIMVLGTPQSTDSVYNILPSLGFNVRIWPARVPSEADMEFYGDLLAPFIREMYENPLNRTGYGIGGLRGAPTDPTRYDDAILIRKEQTQAMGGMFDLQYMLCTKLTDKDRFPLNIDKILFMDVPDREAPTHINTIRSSDKLLKLPAGFSVPQAKLHEVVGFGSQLQEYDCFVMYIDPSGGQSTNSDEVAYSVVKGLNGNVFVDRVHGMKGGYSDENLDHLADTIGYYWSLNIPFTVYCEDNFGDGMFRKLLQSTLKNKRIGIEVLGDKVSNQKEIRIIDTLLPLISSNRLFFNRDLIDMDVACCNQHNARSRNQFSLFHQMKYITRERKALKHDDRLDSLAGALKFFAELLVVDQQDRIDQIELDKKIDRIRTVFPRTADTILKNLGWLEHEKLGGLNHTHFGKFKKDRNNGKSEINKEIKHRSPYAEERERRISEDRAEGKYTSGNAGGHSNFYRRRK